MPLANKKNKIKINAYVLWSVESLKPEPRTSLIDVDVSLRDFREDIHSCLLLEMAVS